MTVIVMTLSCKHQILLNISIFAAATNCLSNADSSGERYFNFSYKSFRYSLNYGRRRSNTFHSRALYVMYILFIIHKFSVVH